MHQCNEYNILQRLFALDANKSIECAPNLRSSISQCVRLIVKSSGMSIFESSSARVFFSLGTYSTIRVILASNPNQKSSRARALSFNRELPRITTPKTFWASA